MPEELARDQLPIPDRPYAGPVFEDAKDPEAKFPADRAAAAARRRPQRAHHSARRHRFWRLERFRWPLRDADRRAAGGERAEAQPLSHDGAVLADAAGAAHRPEPPHGRDGRDHGDRDLGARLQLDPAEHLRAACRDAEAERLLDGAVRQVPRGAGVGDEPARPVRRVADRRRGLRALLRLHRGRDEPVRARDLRRDDAGRAGPDAGGGLPLHRGHDRPGDRLDPRSRRRSCPTSRSSSTSRRARRTRRTTCRRSGRTSTRAGSTTAGTRSGSGRSPVRRSSASCPRTRSSRRGRRRSLPGTTCRTS